MIYSRQIKNLTFLLLCTSAVVSSWTPAHQDASRRRITESWRKAIGSFMLVGLVSVNPVYADQIGVETEAPTLYTGETVEVRELGCRNSFHCH